ncbi:MAG: ABC transporter permease [Clostridium sp.]|nr:ABC transporter permease [Clostridium sp.]
MFIRENINLAIAGLKANKMRSLLTMLGIIIGISSVIAIVSIGSSMTSALNDTLSKLGANNIMVRVMPREDNWNAKYEDSDFLSDDNIEAIKNSYKNKIEGISVDDEYLNGSVKKGYTYANVRIFGVNDEYDEVNNVKLIRGRFISKDDLKGDKKTAVVSDKLVKQIFKNNENPLGKEIKVNSPDNVETYYIVGVYKYETNMLQSLDGGMASEKDIRTSLYTTMSSIKEGERIKNYNYLTILPKKGVDARELAKNINTYLDKLYKQNKKFYAKAEALENQAESMNKVLSLVSVAISVIAAISLLVGGIGVMNIMLVSVTERTREIGTRKALGARSYHIQLQFITEAVIICAIGGLIGIALGVSTGAIVSKVVGTPVSISIPTILISFVFSMTIGVFFGFYPARKAAKLDPIEALRYE